MDVILGNNEMHITFFSLYKWVYQLLYLEKLPLQGTPLEIGYFFQHYKQFNNMS